ncbi:MAG: ATP-binding cassette domain-containing protein, partial [Gammaproteobacteria bacterium]
AAAGYAGCSVIGGVDRDLVPGERLGLLGPNGAGKSTLIKLLAGELAPLAGARREATGLRIGYFAQHQLEQLRPQDTPLQHLSRLDPKASEQSLRDFLGGFGFLGDDAFAPVVPFSGGEKARLVLALLVYQRPNLLLLDEPTNHLDLEMRHALDMALQTYHGALVLVSHDRYLLRTVCDRFVLVTAGRAIDFDGDLDDYRHWLAQRDSITDQGACGSSTHSAEARKTRRRNDAERRRRLKPLKAAVERWEASIAKLESQRDELQRQLAAPDLYMDQNKEKLRTLLNEQPQVTKDLADAETRWLEASEALEAAEGEL